MILVDTSVIVAWLDSTHKHHKECLAGIVRWAGRDQLAVSAVTYAELAAGARTREAVEEDLKGTWILPPPGAQGRLFVNTVRPKQTSRCCLISLFVPRRPC